MIQKKYLNLPELREATCEYWEVRWGKSSHHWPRFCSYERALAAKRQEGNHARIFCIKRYQL